ncbi:MAG: TetR/AcrR family transcriptional regulator [Actinomycetota bacterium]
MTATARRRRSPRGQGARLRGELIAAATELLARLGDAERLSIRAVATAAGVTPPSLYRHFDDKQALLRAVLEERFAEFERFQAEADAGAADPFDALRRRCRAYLRFAEEHPGHYRVLFGAAGLGSELGTDVRGHPGAQAFFGLVGAVQRCLDAGAPVEGDSFVLAVELWALVHGLVDLHNTRPGFPWPPLVAVTDAARAHMGLDGPAHSTDIAPGER